MTSLNKTPIKRSATVRRFAITQSLNSCTDTILYAWKFKSLCKILLTLLSDVPRATECLLAERLGLRMNDCLTASIFSGDRTVRTLPGGFFFNAEALVLKFSTYKCVVLREGTFP
jgi:hypothetical protein